MSDVISSVFNLSPAEKLQLIGELWDDLSATPENVPFPHWQKEELDRRKARIEQHPESARTWEEIVQRIRDRHGC
jgi:putative addiction module component (TIGR02574 family)